MAIREGTARIRRARIKTCAAISLRFTGASLKWPMHLDRRDRSPVLREDQQQTLFECPLTVQRATKDKTKRQKEGAPRCRGARLVLRCKQSVVCVHKSRHAE